MNDTTAVLPLTLEVVGEEREQAGADRPGDESATGAATRPRCGCCGGIRCRSASLARAWA
jgi:hypothetical protein